MIEQLLHTLALKHQNREHPKHGSEGHRKAFDTGHHKAERVVLPATNASSSDQDENGEGPAKSGPHSLDHETQKLS
jgi:hypothetical protein